MGWGAAQAVSLWHCWMLRIGLLGPEWTLLVSVHIHLLQRFWWSESLFISCTASAFPVGRQGSPEALCTELPHLSMPGLFTSCTEVGLAAADFRRHLQKVSQQNSEYRSLHRAGFMSFIVSHTRTRFHIP
jgi:hypothetical protein